MMCFGENAIVSGFAFREVGDGEAESTRTACRFRTGAGTIGGVAADERAQEKGTLDQAGLEFHQREFERLRTELQQAFEQSGLPEVPSGVGALNALLVRIRLASLRME